MAMEPKALPGEADIRKGVLYEQSLKPRFDARATHADERGGQQAQDGAGECHFLVGFAPVAFWFAGALLGNFGIIVGGTAAGLFDVVTAQGIVKSLGMGLMMGFGVAVVLKDILPQVAGICRR